MDELSREQIETLAPGLARWLEPVPDHCALVRLEHRWDRFVDGSMQRRRVADFATDVDGPSLETLCSRAADGFADRGWQHVDFDEEQSRQSFMSGRFMVCVGPARCFLIDAECAALRIDVTEESADRSEVGVGETFQQIVQALGLADPLDLACETIFDVDDLESVHGRRERGTFAVSADPSDSLETAGFSPPRREGDAWWLSEVTGEIRRTVRASPGQDRLILELQTEIQ